MTSKGANKKALFIQRLIAFVIDMLLVYLISGILVSPFINTEESEKLSNKALEIVQQYKDGDISTESYLLQYSDVFYKMARNNGLVSLVTILLYVLYFVVYQLYKGGQTIGKRIMKIRVVSIDGELTTNQMIFRAFLSNFLLMNLLVFVLMLFSSKDVYFYGALVFEMIQYLIVIVSVIMIFNRKDGCAVHDLLVHTKVVQV